MFGITQNTYDKKNDNFTYLCILLQTTKFRATISFSNNNKTNTKQKLVLEDSGAKPN